MEGISHTISLNKTDPSKEQLAIYAVLIRSLRDRAYEHVVFDFEQCAQPNEGKLYFLQMARDGEELHVEIRYDNPDFTMYFKQMTDEEAIDLMREMVWTCEIPDLSEWEDITQSIRKE